MTTPGSKRTTPSKVKRAAVYPDRPGEACHAAAGRFRPFITLSRCEGAGDCVEVCPYDVFDITRIDESAYRSLPFIARIKLRVHGMKIATTPRADQCRACGLCVVACPERAIRLVETSFDEVLE
jgi:NAD-dependent dihydropyrimidine dehydrogenase PreA subunit